MAEKKNKGVVIIFSLFLRCCLLDAVPFSHNANGVHCQKHTFWSHMVWLIKMPSQRLLFIHPFQIPVVTELASNYVP